MSWTTSSVSTRTATSTFWRSWLRPRGLWSRGGRCRRNARGNQAPTRPLGEAVSERVETLPRERSLRPNAVVYMDSGMGQQKVNNATREHPRRSEAIWLNQPLRRVIASRHESPAFTLNPKVEGSNPSRPIRQCAGSRSPHGYAGQACRRTPGCAWRPPRVPPRNLVSGDNRLLLARVTGLQERPSWRLAYGQTGLIALAARSACALSCA
jgi:hypothetical protein